MPLPIVTLSARKSTSDANLVTKQLGQEERDVQLEAPEAPEVSEELEADKAQEIPEASEALEALEVPEVTDAGRLRDNEPKTDATTELASDARGNIQGHDNLDPTSPISKLCSAVSWIRSKGDEFRRQEGILRSRLIEATEHWNAKLRSIKALPDPIDG